MAWALYRDGTLLRMDEMNERMAEQGIYPPVPEGRVVWVAMFQDEQERREKERALERRVEGLKEAVRRWRVKAGVDPAPPAPVIVGSELAVRKNEWVVLEHYALPVEKNPALVREAWECVQEKMRKDMERLYFSEKNGWVAVVRRGWDHPDPRPGRPLPPGC